MIVMPNSVFHHLMSEWSENEGMEPKILIINDDDCFYYDVWIYGLRNVKTTNISELTSKELIFDNTFVPLSLYYLPCPEELYSEKFPMSSGACWNQSHANFYF